MNIFCFCFLIFLNVKCILSGGHGGEKKHEHIKIHVPEIHEHKHHTKYIVIHHHPAKKHHHTHHKPKIPNLHKEYSFHHHFKKEDKHHSSHHEKQGHHGSHGHHGNENKHEHKEHSSSSHHLGGHHGHEMEEPVHYSAPYAPAYSPAAYEPPASHEHYDVTSYQPHNPNVKGVSYVFKKVNVFKTDPHSNNNDIGPGYQVTEENDDGSDENSDEIYQHSYAPSVSYVQGANNSPLTALLNQQQALLNNQQMLLKNMVTHPMHANIIPVQAPVQTFSQGSDESPGSEFEYSEEGSPGYSYSPQQTFLGSAGGPTAAGSSENDDLLQGYQGSAGIESESLTGEDSPDHVTKVGGYQTIVQTGGHQITEF